MIQVITLYDESIIGSQMIHENELERFRADCELADCHFITGVTPAKWKLFSNDIHVADFIGTYDAVNAIADRVPFPGIEFVEAMSQGGNLL